MKLSTVFELLLIFLIIAFAASKVTDSKKPTKWTTLLEKPAEKELRKDRQTPSNRFCSCSNLSCNCCRDFTLPIVPVSGPGCASLKYVQGDSMLLTMSFGDKVLRNVTISGKKPKPICMNLPGGVSKFCGRVYGISRESDQIRACLGLELRAQDDVEAALRVSCFRLGPNGLNIEPGKPLPIDEENEKEDDDDDDDDDDDFELPGDDDDDDDDEADDDDDDDDDDDVFGLGEDDDDSENAVESGESDYGGLSALSDEFIESFFESDSSNKKKKPAVTSAATVANKPASVKPAPTLPVTTPLPAKINKPAKIVTAKVVLSSTPSKIVSSPNHERIVQTTTKYVTTERMPLIDKIPTLSTIDKVYVSPTQYKPTEKIRPPIVQQPLENYIPTVPQLSTEKVYTSPQQISTDKIVYMSTINQYHTKEDEQSSSTSYAPYSPQNNNKEQMIANLYTPTTQQFPSTERIFMPLNSSTVAATTEPIADFEPITSTLMTVNVMQSNNAEEITNETKLVDKIATEVTPDSEYNEVDSDTKTTIDSHYESSTTGTSTTPLGASRYSTLSLILSSASVTSSPSGSTERVKSNKNKDNKNDEDDDDDDDFTDVMETAASVFGTADEESTKPERNETALSDDSELADDGTDSEEDSDESGIVLGNQHDQQSSSAEIGFEENDGKDEEDENEDKEDIDEDGDDDDEDFRKFRRHRQKSKNSVAGTTTLPLASSTTPIVHSGREHKRMNLPPLFSQRPEISSFWSSGGHLYKIRMSPVEEEQLPSAPAPSFNRLRKMNLFVPASETNPATVSGTPTPSIHTTLAPTNDFSPGHRFKVGELNRNHTTDRNRRNNKLLKIFETTDSGKSSLTESR